MTAESGPGAPVETAPFATPLLLELERLRREPLAPPEPGACWQTDDVQRALRAVAGDLLAAYRRLVLVARAVLPAAAGAGGTSVPLAWELRTGLGNALESHLAPLVGELIELSCVTQEELDRE